MQGNLALCRCTRRLKQGSASNTRALGATRREPSACMPAAHGCSRRRTASAVACAAPRCACAKPGQQRGGQRRHRRPARTRHPRPAPCRPRAAPAAQAFCAASAKLKVCNPERQDEHRPRLRQVLPPERCKAAAEQCHVRQAVVQRHFAQAVAQPDVGARRPALPSSCAVTLTSPLPAAFARRRQSTAGGAAQWATALLN